LIILKKLKGKFLAAFIFVGYFINLGHKKTNMKVDKKNEEGMV
jgi:hypothetical protein